MSGSGNGRVLVVEDDDDVRRAMVRALATDGHEVSEAASVEEALRRLAAGLPEVVVSDVNMPGTDGIELLRIFANANLDLPVIFVTGRPSIESAARAVQYGAFRYLTKPVATAELREATREALELRRLSIARDGSGARADLERRLHVAIESMWIALQPIVNASSRNVSGYEALLRSNEPSLPNPLAVLDAAEKLGALHLLGRRVRALVAEIIASGPPDVTYFVNVHPADLADVDLFDVSGPLARHAHRVVLELTERATLEGVVDLPKRLELLRALRYRIAIDDLGAGYAGLSYFASLRPDLMKIDISLVRDVDTDDVKRRVVLSLMALAQSLGIEVVGEGVETAGERDELVRLGCTLLQGYSFARPARPFPEAKWD
jgi:EAL domain-containing protein (putative c-di-GMP-specific phosphodiesterase class I)